MKAQTMYRTAQLYARFYIDPDANCAAHKRKMLLHCHKLGEEKN
jgi:hypothetical protein